MRINFIAMGSKTDISLRIKQLVNEKSNGVTSKFAEELGIGESTVRNWLAGTPPKLEAVIAICGKFAISCEWLIFGTEKVQESEPLQNIETLVSYLKEKDIKIESLIVEKTEYRVKYEQLILESKKTPARQEENVICADAVGSGISK